MLNALFGSQPTAQTRAMWPEQQAMIWIVQGCVAMATGKATVGFERIPTFTDPTRITASASLADCATAFIVGHESGHVQLGHVKHSDVRAMPLLSSRDAPSVKVYQKRHEQEFDAESQRSRSRRRIQPPDSSPTITNSLPCDCVFLSISESARCLRRLNA